MNGNQLSMDDVWDVLQRDISTDPGTVQSCRLYWQQYLHNQLDISTFLSNCHSIIGNNDLFMTIQQAALQHSLSAQPSWEAAQPSPIPQGASPPPIVAHEVPLPFQQIEQVPCYDEIQQLFLQQTNLHQELSQVLGNDHPLFQHAAVSSSDDDDSIHESMALYHRQLHHHYEQQTFFIHQTINRIFIQSYNNTIDFVSSIELHLRDYPHYIQQIRSLLPTMNELIVSYHTRRKILAGSHDPLSAMEELDHISSKLDEIFHHVMQLLNEVVRQPKLAASFSNFCALNYHLQNNQQAFTGKWEELNIIFSELEKNYHERVEQRRVEQKQYKVESRITNLQSYVDRSRGLYQLLSSYRSLLVYSNAIQKPQRSSKLPELLQSVQYSNEQIDMKAGSAFTPSLSTSEPGTMSQEGAEENSDTQPGSRESIMSMDEFRRVFMPFSLTATYRRPEEDCVDETSHVVEESAGITDLTEPDPEQQQQQSGEVPHDQLSAAPFVGSDHPTSVPIPTPTSDQNPDGTPANIVDGAHQQSTTVLTTEDNHPLPSTTTSTTYPRPKSHLDRQFFTFFLLSDESISYHLRQEQLSQYGRQFPETDNPSDIFLTLFPPNITVNMLRDYTQKLFATVEYYKQDIGTEYGIQWPWIVRSVSFPPQELPLLPFIRTITEKVSADCWKYFVRLLNIYNVGIITRDELLEFVYDLFQPYGNLFTYFKETIRYDKTRDLELYFTYHHLMQTSKIKTTRCIQPKQSRDLLLTSKIHDMNQGENLQCSIDSRLSPTKNDNHSQPTTAGFHPSILPTPGLGHLVNLLDLSAVDQKNLSSILSDSSCLSYDHQEQRDLETLRSLHRRQLDVARTIASHTPTPTLITPSEDQVALLTKLTQPLPIEKYLPTKPASHHSSSSNSPSVHQTHDPSHASQDFLSYLQKQQRQQMKSLRLYHRQRQVMEYLAMIQQRQRLKMYYTVPVTASSIYNNFYKYLLHVKLNRPDPVTPSYQSLPLYLEFPPSSSYNYLTYLEQQGSPSITYPFRITGTINAHLVSIPTGSEDGTSVASADVQGTAISPSQPAPTATTSAGVVESSSVTVPVGDSNSTVTTPAPSTSDSKTEKTSHDRNIYEEKLLQVEDQQYELDMLIAPCRSAITYFERTLHLFNAYYDNIDRVNQFECIRLQEQHQQQSIQISNDYQAMLLEYHRQLEEYQLSIQTLQLLPLHEQMFHLIPPEPQPPMPPEFPPDVVFSPVNRSKQALLEPIPRVYHRPILLVYGSTYGHDILNSIKQTPYVAIPVVIATIRQKINEWTTTRDSLTPYWRSVTSASKLKALDHRSAHFKVDEPRYRSPKQLFLELRTPYSHGGGGEKDAVCISGYEHYDFGYGIDQQLSNDVCQCPSASPRLLSTYYHELFAGTAQGTPQNMLLQSPQMPSAMVSGSVVMFPQLVQNPVDFLSPAPFHLRHGETGDLSEGGSHQSHALAKGTEDELVEHAFESMTSSLNTEFTYPGTNIQLGTIVLPATSPFSFVSPHTTTLTVQQQNVLALLHNAQQPTELQTKHDNLAIHEFQSTTSTGSSDLNEIAVQGIPLLTLYQSDLCPYRLVSSACTVELYDPSYNGGGVTSLSATMSSPAPGRFKTELSSAMDSDSQPLSSTVQLSQSSKSPNSPRSGLLPINIPVQCPQCGSHTNCPRKYQLRYHLQSNIAHILVLSSLIHSATVIPGASRGSILCLIHFFTRFLYRVIGVSREVIQQAESVSYTILDDFTREQQAVLSTIEGLTGVKLINTLTAPMSDSLDHDELLLGSAEQQTVIPSPPIEHQSEVGGDDHQSSLQKHHLDLIQTQVSANRRAKSGASSKRRQARTIARSRGSKREDVIDKITEDGSTIMPATNLAHFHDFTGNEGHVGLKGLVKTTLPHYFQANEQLYSVLYSQDKFPSSIIGYDYVPNDFPRLHPTFVHSVSCGKAQSDSYILHHGSSGNASDVHAHVHHHNPSLNGQDCHHSSLHHHHPYHHSHSQHHNNHEEPLDYKSSSSGQQQHQQQQHYHHQRSTAGAGSPQPVPSLSASPSSSFKGGGDQPIFPLIACSSIYVAIRLYMQLYQRVWSLIVTIQSSSSQHVSVQHRSMTDEIFDSIPQFVTTSKPAQPAGRTSSHGGDSHLPQDDHPSASTIIQQWEWLTYSAIHGKITYRLYEDVCQQLLGPNAFIMINYHRALYQLVRQVNSILFTRSGLKTILFYDWFRLTSHYKHGHTRTIDYADAQLLHAYSHLCFSEISEESLVKVAYFPQNEITGFGYLDNIPYREVGYKFFGRHLDHYVTNVLTDHIGYQPDVTIKSFLPSKNLRYYPLISLNVYENNNLHYNNLNNYTAHENAQKQQLQQQLVMQNQLHFIGETISRTAVCSKPFLTRNVVSAMRYFTRLGQANPREHCVFMDNMIYTLSLETSCIRPTPLSSVYYQRLVELPSVRALNARLRRQEQLSHTTSKASQKSRSAKSKASSQAKSRRKSGGATTTSTSRRRTSSIDKSGDAGDQNDLSNGVKRQRTSSGMTDDAIVCLATSARRKKPSPRLMTKYQTRLDKLFSRLQGQIASQQHPHSYQYRDSQPAQHDAALHGASNHYYHSGGGYN